MKDIGSKNTVLLAAKAFEAGPRGAGCPFQLKQDLADMGVGYDENGINEEPTSWITRSWRRDLLQKSRSRPRMTAFPENIRFQQFIEQ